MGSCCLRVLRRVFCMHRMAWFWAPLMHSGVGDYGARGGISPLGISVVVNHNERCLIFGGVELRLAHCNGYMVDGYREKRVSRTLSVPWLYGGWYSASCCTTLFQIPFSSHLPAFVVLHGRWESGTMHRFHQTTPYSSTSGLSGYRVLGGDRKCPPRRGFASRLQVSAANAFNLNLLSSAPRRAQPVSQEQRAPGAYSSISPPTSCVRFQAVTEDIVSAWFL